MIYYVIGDDETVWEGLIQQRFPDDDDYLKVGPCQWLVDSDASTSKTVWERIVGGDHPTGMVFPVRGYYGYHNATIWEWIAAKRNAGNGD